MEINDLKNAFEKGLSILIIFVPDLEKLFLEAFAFLNYIDFVLFYCKLGPKSVAYCGDS